MREGRKERKVTSPASSDCPANGLSRVPEHTSSLGWGVPFYRQVSHFVCKLVLCRMFFQAFMEWVRGLQGSWVVLIFPYTQCPLVSLVPALVLYCIVLIPRNENRDVWPGKVVPCSHMVPSSSHALFFPVACSYQQFLSVYYQQSLVGCTAIWLLCLRHAH